MPYEKILELVEAKQLDITTVSLAKITADFVEYTRTLEDRQVSPSLLADFVAVAAKLLLIKSKTLLPSLELTEEEERDVKELEERLKFYKEIKIAATQLNQLWQSPQRCFSRPPTILTAGFYPPKNLSSQQLLNTFRLIASSWEKIIKETKAAKATFISVESKIKEILARFTTTANQKLNALTSNQSRDEIIAIFLAILHLSRGNQIKTKQDKLFGEITIEHTI